MEPSQFDSVSMDGLSGKVILTCFPGRGLGDEFSFELLDDVFRALSARGCRTLVSLVEDREFAGFCGKPLFAEQMEEYGFAWHHLPISDFQVPDLSFLEAWKSVSMYLIDELRMGRDVCLHCKGGIGRSGTVAALLLVDQGVESDEAIMRVRRARIGAIETAEQESFVRSYRG